MDPEVAFDFLSLTPDASMRDARRSFRRIARELHPDRGGDAESFHLLEEAFKAVVRTLAGRDRRLRTLETLMEQNEIMDDEVRATSMGISDRDISDRGDETFTQRFNRVFEQCPSAPDPYKRGYEDLAPEPQAEKKYSSFKKASRAFDRETSGCRDSSLVVYGPPQPIAAAGPALFELGVDAVADFSSGDAVDYQRAYRCGRLRPEDPKPDGGITLNDLEKSRARPLVFGDQDPEYVKAQRVTDSARRKALQRADDVNFRIYKEANRLMLASDNRKK